MSDPRTHPAPVDPAMTTPPEVRPPRANLGGLILALAVISFFLASWGFLYVTSRASFCANCHEMRPEFLAWQKSPHRQTECVDCHIGPGLDNFVAGKLLAARDLYLHLTNQVPSEIRLDTEIPNRTCEACHPLERQSRPSTLLGEVQVKIKHDKHIVKEGMSCTDCHSAISHAKLADQPELREALSSQDETDHPKLETNAYYPEMIPCVNCHRDKGAAFGCQTCHKNDVRPTNHLQPGFRTSHPIPPDRTAKNACIGRCHDGTECQQCHDKIRAMKN